jgi:hypothetical protein
MKGDALDRMLKLVIVLTLLLFLVQAATGVLSRGIEALFMGAASTLGHASSFLAGLLFSAVMLCFLIGFLVRFIRFLTMRDPRVARERASRDRAMRQRVRRPSEGVPPLATHREHMADPDPAIGMDEARR